MMKKNIIFILCIISFTIQNICILDAEQDNNRLPSGYILQVNLLCDSAKSPLPKEVLASIKRLAPQVLPKKKTIGKRLKWLIDQAGLNQTQCAKLLCVKPPVLNRWIRDMSNPNAENLKKITILFCVPYKLIKANSEIVGERLGISQKALERIKRLAPQVLPKKKTIGKRLKWLMDQAGLNQPQCAELLGINTSVLGVWVNQKNNPNPDNIQKIAKLFGISYELFKGSIVIHGDSPCISQKALDNIKKLAPQALPKKKTIGKRLKWLMKKAGLNQPQCAQLLGVNTSILGIWVNDTNNPKSDSIQKIAELFGISFELLKGSIVLYGDSPCISQKALDNIRKLAPQVLPKKKTIGKRLKWLMKKAGLNQPQCAQLLGIDASMLNLWVNDKHNPRAGSLKKLAKLFGIPVELLEGSAASASLPVKAFANLSAQV